jgi:nucleotide-binding universal stress UspA family protein
MTTPIAVGTDGSPPAEHAVAWAATEAARRRRRLHVVHAVRSRKCGVPFHAGLGQVDSLTDAGEYVLARAAELAAKAAPDVTLTTELVFEAPAFALREQARRATEIVVGHRGLGGFAGLLLGSTGLSLVGRPPCPLIVVRTLSARSGRRCSSASTCMATSVLRSAWVRAVHTWEVPPTSLTGRNR